MNHKGRDKEGYGGESKQIKSVTIFDDNEAGLVR